MRRTVLAISVACLSLLLLPDAASAQLCEGFTPIKNDSRLLAGGMFAYSHSQYGTVAGGGGGLTGGGDSWFAGGSVARIAYSYSGANVILGSLQVNGEAGVQIPTTQGRLSRRYVTSMVCPVFSFGREFGPDYYSQKSTTANVGGGLSYGLIAADTGTLEVVPTASVRVWRISQNSTNANFPQLAQSSRTTQGMLSFGVGFVVDRRYCVVPMIGIPLGGYAQSTTLTVSAAFSFRESRR